MDQREENRVSLSKCKLCHSVLNHPNASKCHACQAYQNWKYYLGFSTTFLAMLTALASVVALSWSNIEPYINDQHVSINAVGVNDSGLALAVLNNTLSIAWLESITLKLVENGVTTKIDVELENNNRIIKKLEPVILKVKLKHIESLFIAEFSGVTADAVRKDVKNFFEGFFNPKMSNRLNQINCHVVVKFVSGDKYQWLANIDLSNVSTNLTEAHAASIISRIAGILNLKYAEVKINDRNIIKQVNNMCAQLLLEIYISTFKTIIDGRNSAET